MKTLLQVFSLSLSFLLLIESAIASPYYRFWRGFKRDDLSHQKFHTGLNKLFIPRTVEQGEGKGLLSYLPVLTLETKPASIPDEIALVTYQNKEVYRQIRNTPAGQTYGRMHWDYFAKGKSKSLVPRPLPMVESLSVDTAYDVLQSSHDWQKGYVLFNIRLRRQSSSSRSFRRSYRHFLDYMKKTYAKDKLESFVVLIGKTYVIEYQLWKNRPDYFSVRNSQRHKKQLERLSAHAGLFQQHPLPNKNQPISFGQGINTRF